MKHSLIFFVNMPDSEVMDTKLKSRLSNEKGQGAIEYILVLTVVLFFLQAVYQLNVAFRDWAEDYYVSYIRCLLETGEVPSLGGAQTVGLCDEEFAPFTFTGGRPPRAGSGDDQVGAGSSSGSSSSDSNSNASAEGKGRSGRGSERSFAGGSSRGRIGRFASSGSSGGSAGGDEDEKGSQGGSSGDEGGFVQANLRRNKIKQRQIDESGGDELGAVGKKKKKRGKEKSVVSDNEENSAAARNKKILVQKLKKKTDIKNEDLEFGFGLYLRFLIIAAIIIALVLLVGGQLVQINKGLDAE